MGLFSSLFGSGNKSAYDTSGLAREVGKSNDLYKSIYDTSLAGGQTWLDLGTNAANQLGSSLPSLTTPFSIDAYTNSDQYKYLQDEAQKAVERSAAARGSVYSPSTSKALQDRAANVASTYYTDMANNDLNQKQSIFNMLNNLSGTGQNQAATNAQYGWNYADSVSNNNIGLQNAILGAAQSKNAATQGMLGNWMNLAGALGGGYLSGLARK